MSLRVISGILKNRRIKVSKHPLMRPTAERVREALFSMISDRIVGATFLDACAGSGIVGLEALSRGARAVTFVEQANVSFKMLRSNLRDLALDQHEGLSLIRGSAKKLKGKKWDLSFWDPPYVEEPDMWLEAAQRLTSSVFIYEHTRRISLPEQVVQFRLVDVRTYGETKISIYSI